MPAIVTDERRSNRPKSARPEGVAPEYSPDVVASLVRATSPAYATRLTGKYSGAISVQQYHTERV
jgi:hypothetical protein